MYAQGLGLGLGLWAPALPRVTTSPLCRAFPEWMMMWPWPMGTVRARPSNRVWPPSNSRGSFNRMLKLDRPEVRWEKGR